MAREGKLRFSVYAGIVLAALSLLLSLASATIASAGDGTQSRRGLASASPADAFTTRDAARLLDQIGAGLIGHNRQKTLAVFDLTRMADGRLFEQQITSFLAHTGIIRVHYNGIDAETEEGEGIASVDFEMEAAPRDDDLPPVRKQARLRLVAENTAAGWKLIDVQPRSFFSLSQP